jgi:hypothetical protein
LRPRQLDSTFLVHAARIAPALPVVKDS